MLRREKIRTAIVTTDNDFKRTAISLLNNTGFLAEKIQFSDYKALVKALHQDQLLLNLIFDLSDIKAGSEPFLDENFLKLLRSRQDLSVLVYVSQGKRSSWKGSQLLKNFGHVHILELPMNKTQLLSAKSPTRPSDVVKNLSKNTELIDGSVNSELRAAARDAGQYLKQALEQINGLAADPSNMNYLATIGQRFNGMMGTFAFFTGVKGAAELSLVGRIVEGIARSYAMNPKPAVAHDHLQILIGCCRATLPLLRAVALSEPLPDGILRELDVWRAAYEGDLNLLKRQSLDQQKVDGALRGEQDQDDSFRRSFTETSLHLRTAIEHLNVVLNDRNRLDALAKVGQLFNGVFGTFAFFRERLGSSSLIELSSIIDNLCRSYANHNAEAVADDHLRLLRDAAETCFHILKQLRQGQRPDAAYLETVKSLVERAQTDDRIARRNSLVQGDVDQLIDDLLAA